MLNFTGTGPLPGLTSSPKDKEVVLKSGASSRSQVPDIAQTVSWLKRAKWEVEIASLCLRINETVREEDELQDNIDLAVRKCLEVSGDICGTVRLCRGTKLNL